MDRVTIEANGLEFACLRAGTGDRVALCLHGFPDDAGTFEPLLESLAAAGYTAVAPYMRGYEPTGPAPDGDYTTTALGTDALALAAALSDDPVALIGHDWGAVAAYTAATRDPAAVDTLVGMAVPPRFASQLFEHPEQLARSWYIWFVQLEGMAEYAIRRNDFALLEYLWSTWSPGWDWPAERLEAVRETFRRGETLEAALAYYRQLVGPLATDGGGIAVPGLVIGGRDDGCIGIELYEGATDAFSAEARFIDVEGAGHFVHRERPELVTEEILAFLSE